MTEGRETKVKEKRSFAHQACTRFAHQATRPKQGCFGSIIEGGFNTFYLRFTPIPFSHPRFFPGSPPRASSMLVVENRAWWLVVMQVGDASITT